MVSAQASVGAAATWPTRGTIFNAADPTRHGAAAAPHPAKVAQANSRTEQRSKFPRWNIVISCSRDIIRERTVGKHVPFAFFTSYGVSENSFLPIGLQAWTGIVGGSYTASHSTIRDCFWHVQEAADG